MTTDKPINISIHLVVAKYLEFSNWTNLLRLFFKIYCTYIPLPVFI